MTDLIEQALSDQEITQKDVMQNTIHTRAQATITVSLNGETRELEHCSLAAAIEQWAQQGQTFAVAVNEQFIPKGQYKSIQLQDNDRIELLVPMQGG